MQKELGDLEVGSKKNGMKYHNTKYKVMHLVTIIKSYAINWEFIS